MLTHTSTLANMYLSLDRLASPCYLASSLFTFLLSLSTYHKVFEALNVLCRQPTFAGLVSRAASSGIRTCTHVACSSK
jgi:hypothetical protein